MKEHKYSLTSEKKAVEKWNKKHVIGTIVRYWKGVRDGDPSGASATRTEALIIGGAAVVWVDGEASCIALSHVEAGS